MRAPKSKQELIKEAYQKGFEKESILHGCAPCTFLAIEEVLGMEKSSEAIYKASTGLSGGVGLSIEGHCGALSGGALAIGRRFGRDFRGPEDLEAYQARLARPNDLCRKLEERFREAYGTIICQEIQKKLFGRTFNLQDQKELEEFAAAGGFTEKCPSVVGTGARLAVEIILEEEEALG